MRWLLLAVGCFSFTAAGCSAAITWSPLRSAGRALFQRPAANVELFTTAPPTRPYVEVGLLEGHNVLGASRTPWIDAPHLVAKLRAAAAKAGCDGLVIAAGGSVDTVRATCIVYGEPTASR